MTGPTNRHSSRPSLASSALVLLLLVVAGCGGSDDSEASGGIAIVESGGAGSGDSDVAGGDAANSTADGGDEDDDDDAGTGDDDGSSDTSTTAAGANDEALPGTPFDIGPPAGSALDVVGVRHDDVLNFRTRPDPSAAIVDTAAPLSVAPSVISTGGGRLLANSAWWKVTVDGAEAWANLTFLGMLGGEDDILTELQDSLGSTSAADVDDLIDDIAQSRASGPEPRVELVTPVEGLDADGAQVVVDVIGLGDDAVKGERLLLTFDLNFEDPDATPLEVESYELVGALRTVICGRGLSGEACT